MDESLLVQSTELDLRFSWPQPQPHLSFRGQDYEPWRDAAREKLAELLNVREKVSAGPARKARAAAHDGITIEAVVMTAEEGLSIPAYLLVPPKPKGEHAVVAIHGHGDCAGALGIREDYHHGFAMSLAKAGHVVLCPELRGFGALCNLAAGHDGQRLDYWTGTPPMAYSLATDAFQKGHTLIGATVEDLLRWEDLIVQALGRRTFRVAAISYGADLALAYAAFSPRVERIFASGTLGSFSAIFSRCYNAPAHCIPGIMKWMDRADIAGLCAPRPIAFQYGELDKPGPGNYSASYNDTVEPSIRKLRMIYMAARASHNIHLVVSPGLRHEMDVPAMTKFLA